MVITDHSDTSDAIIVTALYPAGSTDPFEREEIICAHPIPSPLYFFYCMFLF
jgi:hypothetical protein